MSKEAVLASARKILSDAERIPNKDVRRDVMLEAQTILQLASALYGPPPTFLKPGDKYFPDEPPCAP